MGWQVAPCKLWLRQTDDPFGPFGSLLAALENSFRMTQRGRKRFRRGDLGETLFRRRKAYDLDRAHYNSRSAIEALSTEREALWERVHRSDFLTVNEKRAAVGYEPVEGGDRLAEAVGGE